MIEMSVQEIIEQLQQILACEGVCLILGCPEQELRHPLLSPPSIADFPLIVGGAGLFEAIPPQEILQNECIQLLCDLALQTGRMQTLSPQPRWLGEDYHIQSIASMPLERPGGMLGTLLLADRSPGQFNSGEESLLHASLSIYTSYLEQQLRDQLHREIREGARSTNQATPASPLIRGEFISMIGHELRAPLSIIKGYTELLQIYGSSACQPDLEMSPERQQHYLNVIIEQTNLLELLVSDLVDIARLQEGKLRLRPGSVDVAKLCEQIAQLGQLRADQQAPGKYLIESKVACSLPPVLADIDRLRQVLLNVLENAIKYSPDGGHIELIADLCESQSEVTVSSGPANEQVRFTIRDQGIGIPPAYTSRLFHPFERLERPAIAQIAGTGLGLYIAHRLVEAMNGCITVQSQPGRGTTVSVSLPTSRPEDAVDDRELASICSLVSHEIS